MLTRRNLSSSAAPKLIENAKFKLTAHCLYRVYTERESRLTVSPVLLPRPSGLHILLLLPASCIPHFFTQHRLTFTPTIAHPLFILPIQSQLTLGEWWGSAWTGRQHITGPTHRDKYSCPHSHSRLRPI